MTLPENATTSPEQGWGMPLRPGLWWSDRGGEGLDRVRTGQGSFPLPSSLLTPDTPDRGDTPNPNHSSDPPLPCKADIQERRQPPPVRGVRLRDGRVALIAGTGGWTPPPEGEPSLSPSAPAFGQASYRYNPGNPASSRATFRLSWNTT